MNLVERVATFGKLEGSRADSLESFLLGASSLDLSIVAASVDMEDTRAVILSNLTISFTLTLLFHSSTNSPPLSTSLARREPLSRPTNHLVDRSAPQLVVMSYTYFVLLFMLTLLFCSSTNYPHHQLPRPLSCDRRPTPTPFKAESVGRSS